MTGSAKQSIAPAVIASEAKQSILPRKGRMDCFAALAMTVSGRWHSKARHTRSRHRPPTGRASARPMTGSAKQSIARAVIASEAKQSILPQRKNGLLRCARNDVEEARNDVEFQTHVHGLAAHSRDPLARNDGAGSLTSTASAARAA